MLSSRHFAALAALWACASVAPPTLAAQASAGDGFMFGRPGGTLTLRAGFARPSENSDLFSFVQHHLTIGNGAFSGGSFSAELGFFLRDRLSLQLGTGYSSRTVGSVYRDWVDNNNAEIEQSSSFKRLPITLGLRYYLMPPGRALGTLAWIPARMAPYVAAGGGTTWYSFRQAGDFVDYQNLDVFNARLSSTAWGPTAYGAAGVDYSLSARTGLVAEVRYDRGSAGLGSDFSGFHNIDLSGLSTTIGLTVRF